MEVTRRVWPYCVFSFSSASSMAGFSATEVTPASPSGLVFADEAARRDLERLVHPAVYRAISAGLRAFELVEAPALAVVDIPLLYETGRAADFDRVIVTVCDPELQRQRLLARGLSEIEAEQRLAAQMPAAEKAARGDIVIDTNGSFEDTERQVVGVLSAITNRTDG